MKVLQVHNQYQRRGGEDTVASNEAAMLTSRQDLTVKEVVTSNDAIEPPGSIGARIVLARNTIWSSTWAEEIRNISDEFSPGIAHFHNTFPLLSPSVLQAARSSGAAVVQTLHNYRLSCVRADFLRSGRICESCLGNTVPLGGVVHRCYHNSFAQSAVAAAMISFHNLRGTFRQDVDAFIALTEFGRQKAIEAGLEAEKVHVKPNFLTAGIEVGPYPRSGFAFVGRLASEKGIAPLLEAVRREPPSSPFRVAGTGPLSPEVERAAELGTIEYCGDCSRDEIFALLRTVRALVVPSIWFEGFPMTILEAFATGTPVIASRIGGIPEIVDDGITGLLVEPGNVDDLIRNLRWAEEHTAEMAQMGVAARAAFEARYTAERNLPQLLAIYDAAIKNRTRNPPRLR